MGGPDNIDRSSIISSGGMSNHDMPLPSSGPNGDIHKRVTRASAASAAAGVSPRVLGADKSRSKLRIDL